MMKYLLIIIILVSSCTPQKRVERIIRNNPWMQIADTVVVHDTIMIPQVSVDTVIVSKPIDTILIQQDRLRVEIIRYYDTLKVTAECQADTVYTQKEIVVNKIKTVEVETNTIPIWAIILLIAMSIGLVFMGIKK